MLRNLLTKTASNGFNISNNPVCVQSVRWRRKPRWLPTARSKMFKVPERHILPDEEKQEWLRLNNNYRFDPSFVKMKQMITSINFL